MKGYYRLMLGQQSRYASNCFAEEFVGTDFSTHMDLTGQFPEELHEFNQQFISVYLQVWPDKSKVAAWLTCGAIWTLSKGVQEGDVVLCPDENGSYRIGEITGPHYYADCEILTHRRPVTCWKQTITKGNDRGARNEPGTGSTLRLKAFPIRLARLARHP